VIVTRRPWLSPFRDVVAPFPEPLRCAASGGLAPRVRAGISDSRAELTATESWLEQRDELLQLDSAALSSDIGLQRALGGGYPGPAGEPAPIGFGQLMTLIDIRLRDHTKPSRRWIFPKDLRYKTL